MHLTPLRVETATGMDGELEAVGVVDEAMERVAVAAIILPMLLALHIPTSRPTIRPETLATQLTQLNPSLRRHI